MFATVGGVGGAGRRGSDGHCRATEKAGVDIDDVGVTLELTGGVARTARMRTRERVRDGGVDGLVEGGARGEGERSKVAGGDAQARGDGGWKRGCCSWARAVGKRKPASGRSSACGQW